MVALRPAWPIFVQNRKVYGSFLGHVNEVPAFREKYSGTPPKSGRCSSDAENCDRLFDPVYAKKSGFGHRSPEDPFSSSVKSFYERFVKRTPNPSSVIGASSLTGASTIFPTLYNYLFEGIATNKQESKHDS